MKTAKELIREVAKNKELVEEVLNMKTEQEAIDFLRKHDCDASYEEAEKAMNEYLSEKSANFANLGEQVSGGSQKVGGSRYSSDWPYNLIVTIGNSCKLYKEDPKRGGIKGTCNHCDHIRPLRYFVSYCNVRFVNDDPVRDGRA